VGLGIAGTAEVLGVSEPTVERDWRFARAFLHDRLRKGSTDMLNDPKTGHGGRNGNAGG